MDWLQLAKVGIAVVVAIYLFGFGASFVAALVVAKQAVGWAGVVFTLVLGALVSFLFGVVVYFVYNLL